MHVAGERVRSLDGVRGLAILAVVVGHTAPQLVRYGGTVGVTLFFVLSGYLITSVLLREIRREGRLDWAAFYARRGLRLLPAVLVVLVAAPALMWAVGDPRLDDYPGDGLAVLLYYGNIVRASGGELGPLDHTWSLSVEEQFYLVWPVVLLLALRFGRSAVRTVTVLAVVALGWRLAAAALFDFERVYFAPDTNAFALLLGAALAARDVEHGRGDARSPVLMWGALAALGACCLFPSFGYMTTDLTIVAYAAPLVALAGLGLIVAARTHDHWLLAHPALTWFGRVSYAWYLWHELLMQLQIDGADPSALQRVVGAVVSLLVAWASWHIVEAPALRFKTRFERVREPAGQAGTAVSSR